MTRPATIRAVAFDFDGLMFNTEEVFTLCGTELLRRRGKIPHPQLFHSMMGRRAPEAFQAMIDLMELQETIEELTVESGLIFEDLLEMHLLPMPGLFELLELIEARGLPKGVATSSGRKYLSGLLERFRLADRFHATLTGEDVSHGKPHPEIYLRTAEALGVDPTEMLVLEDSENGTRAAVNAGAYVISVPHDHSRHHDFTGARGVAQSLADPLITGLFLP